MFSDFRCSLSAWDSADPAPCISCSAASAHAFDKQLWLNTATTCEPTAPSWGRSINAATLLNPNSNPALYGEQRRARTDRRADATEQGRATRGANASHRSQAPIAQDHQLSRHLDLIHTIDRLLRVKEIFVQQGAPGAIRALGHIQYHCMRMQLRVLAASHRGGIWRSPDWPHAPEHRSDMGAHGGRHLSAECHLA